MKRENWMKEQADFSDDSLSKEDKDLFELLFNELGNIDEISISDNFANKVVAKQVRKDTFWRDIKLYAFYATLFIALIGVCALIIGLDASQNTNYNIQELSSYLTYGLIAAVGYFCIQTLDRILVKKEGMI
ncbi:hypothetical protein [Arcticibacterium luteifluviistationis]|uniref:Uncharacterized protein n=1 Tax=Arcticibacterium luteifluviistationis TaxID=1784714 RepID=A0A2Z4G7R3_9BACT|nr:hypothetical protein [Arcticibacterium luteifluviistationis]AWV97214.1 hypothetical protein DJ013_03125 [Arcticibacterium luteifluviistationis]